MRRIGELRLAGDRRRALRPRRPLLARAERPGSCSPSTAVAGVGIVWAVVALSTAYQRRSPSDMQGRVAAAANMLFSVPQTISIAVGAALITLVDYRIEIVTMAVVFSSPPRYLLTRARPTSDAARSSPRSPLEGRPALAEPRLRPALESGSSSRRSARRSTQLAFPLLVLALTTRRRRPASSASRASSRISSSSRSAGVARRPVEPQARSCSPPTRCACARDRQRRGLARRRAASVRADRDRRLRRGCALRLLQDRRVGCAPPHRPQAQLPLAVAENRRACKALSSPAGPLRRRALRLGAPASVRRRRHVVCVLLRVAARDSHPVPGVARAAADTTRARRSPKGSAGSGASRSCERPRCSSRARTSCIRDFSASC